MAKARWTKRAELSLYEIADYIAQRDNIEAALRWIAKLRDRANRAAMVPRTGRVVPELGAPDIREVLLGNYRIIYRATRPITILVVIEGHHLVPDDVAD